jgi:MFS transporter, DHA2 family, multidrug resistance protein
MGTLGDRIGRRKLLFIGAAAFMVGSMVAAYSVNPTMLIIARAGLGIAGATLMPSTLGLITNMFRDDNQRGKAISIWATCQFTGGALGPALAGLLLAHFWWGSVFLIAVPIMALLLMVGPFVLPEYRSQGHDRLDLFSVVLSLATVLPMVYGLKQLTVDGTRSLTLPLVAIVVGIVFGVVFVRRQLTLETPLLNLRLLRNGPFASVLGSLVLAGIAMAGTGLLVTQYLQSVLGYSALESAILFAPMGLGVAAGTMFAPALARRVGQSIAIAGGMVLSILGSLALTFADATHGLPVVMVGIFVLALGTGPLFALGTGLVVGSVPPERAGSAASMSETGNYYGSSLGIALLGAISAAVYHAHMAGTVAVGAPAAAGENLADAGAVSHQLPAAQAADLLHAANNAFTSALNITGIIAAVMFAGIAILVGTKGRQTVSEDRPEELPEPVREPEGVAQS